VKALTIEFPKQADEPGVLPERIFFNEKNEAFPPGRKETDERIFSEPSGS
jgi:hypothetical protein